MANPVASFFNTTASGQNAEVPGARFEGDIEISLTGVTYVTGGLTVASLCTGLPLSLVTNFMPICLGTTLDGTVNEFSFDRANQKVKLWANPLTPTETTNTAPLDAYKLYARVAGRR